MLPQGGGGDGRDGSPEDKKRGLGAVEEQREHDSRQAEERQPTSAMEKTMRANLSIADASCEQCAFGRQLYLRTARASASSSTAWRGLRVVKCPICWRQETPVIAMGVVGAAPSTAGKSRRAPMALEMS